jgi:parallel beta-helix repeat protein
MPYKPILFLYFSIYFFCNSISATTYFVSNSGDDLNDGLTLSTAFETLQNAADIVTAGDSVLVENGTYVGFALWNGGNSSAPIVFKTLGENVLINEPCSTTDGINVENADYVIIDGFIVNDQPRNGIRLALANNCIVRNNSCDNNFERGIFTAFTDDILIENNVCSNSIDEHGIYVSNSSDRPIIRFNECFGNNNIGIHMNGDLSAGGDGIISDAQVYGNVLHDNNLAAGLNMDGLENPLIFNNLIYNNHNAQGIALFQQDGAIPTRGAKIYNNTIIVPDDGRWGILVNSGSNIGTEIFNNIIINQHSWRGCISTESIDQFSSDYNILNDKMSDEGDGSTISLSDWQNLGLDQNSLIVNPLATIFVDPSQHDYHLLDANSQAVDAGTTIPSVDVDLDGNLRPSGSGFDIGAYEFQGTTALADILEKSKISFHPNPFKSDIFLSNTDLDKLYFSLTNITGKEVFRGKVIDNKITVGNHPKGTYILTIRNEEGRIVHSGMVVKI